MKLELRRVGTLGADARNYFLSPFARIEEIINQEVKEDMRFFDADKLAFNLVEMAPFCVRLLNEMLQLIEDSSNYQDDYREYFGAESIAALKAAIKLMENIPEEAAELKKIVIESPAYKDGVLKRASLSEKAKYRVSVPFSIMQALRNFQAALSEHRESLVEIKQKLDREHIEDEFALRYHE